MNIIVMMILLVLFMECMTFVVYCG